MAGIEIHGDLDSPFLTVTLRDILPCLQAPAAMQWRVWRLEAWSATEWTLDGLSGQTYEEGVDATPDGYPITREQMQLLAEAPAQLVNLVLLGSTNFATVPSFATKAALYTACEYVLEFFDSSYAIVYSVDEAFITCLRNRLAGVKTIPQVA
ncbi:hypothetical protein [Hymenobacter cavernae]|uniref:Uncharacterized protein n=1 Tax=Hymenobacter cavernae TaxID=2044852 RepID=A0ABQ1UY88_9BACT|nr:hypothetical protein [Hymenobacter cavernae]GGF28177.1 hypothetical protein GCM10011383_44900 [Hymenobacter cavernae]